MSTTINRKRLWLLLTLIWCVGISFYFSHEVAREYKQSLVRLSSTASSRIDAAWEACATKLEPNYYLIASEACRIELEGVVGTPFIWQEKPSETWLKMCVESKVPKCSHIFEDAQTQYLNTPKWKRALTRTQHFMSYSNSLWVMSLLLILGPTLFALIPLTYRSLRRWLTNS